MRRVLFLLLAVGLLTSCSEFNKALKSTDAAYKMEVAEKYYSKEKWDRALPLLEELIMIKRGTSESEKVNYMFAKCYFYMKDYTMAGYYLANFTHTFPSSQYTEECAFLSALCFYKNSPSYELDQTDTRNAIDQLQLFMVRYPETTLKDSCNALIDGLRSKLEVKGYHAADQYFRMRNYQAASVAFKDFVRVWPNSKYREDAMLTILRSDTELAMNSIEVRKVERLREAIRSYRNFADAYPQSAMMDDAEKLNKQLNDALQQVTHTP
ncbi:MAG: outer membrane protein assembly factor BamD [Flavobacteriales bacterium]